MSWIAIICRSTFCFPVPKWTQNCSCSWYLSSVCSPDTSQLCAGLPSSAGVFQAFPFQIESELLPSWYLSIVCSPDTNWQCVKFPAIPFCIEPELQSQLVFMHCLLPGHQLMMSRIAIDQAGTDTVCVVSVWEKFVHGFPKAIFFFLSYFSEASPYQSPLHKPKCLPWCVLLKVENQLAAAPWDPFSGGCLLITWRGVNASTTIPKGQTAPTELNYVQSDNNVRQPTLAYPARSMYH